jgi:hypothetical protein
MLVTRLRGVRYQVQDVQKAVVLLTHPALGAALGDGEKGVSLARSREALIGALRALADQLEGIEAETGE